MIEFKKKSQNRIFTSTMDLTVMKIEVWMFKLINPIPVIVPDFFIELSKHQVFGIFRNIRYLIGKTITKTWFIYDHWIRKSRVNICSFLIKNICWFYYFFIFNFDLYLFLFLQKQGFYCLNFNLKFGTLMHKYQVLKKKGIYVWN